MFRSIWCSQNNRHLLVKMLCLERTVQKVSLLFSKAVLTNYCWICSFFFKESVSFRLSAVVDKKIPPVCPFVKGTPGLFFSWLTAPLSLKCSSQTHAHSVCEMVSNRAACFYRSLRKSWRINTFIIFQISFSFFMQGYSVSTRSLCYLDDSKGTRAGTRHAGYADVGQSK